MRVAPDPLLERIRQDATALALSAPSVRWTRAELLGAADALAASLHAEGLGEGRRIAALLADDAPAIVLIHAARRLGAVHVPLNRRASSLELRAQLELVGAHGLVFDASHASLARAAAPQGPALHRVEALMAAAPCTVPPRLRDTIELPAAATIVFTSGTTARPKGALLTHDNHRASAHAWASVLRPHPGDRWLLCLPLFHVAGLAIVTRTTRWGAALEVLPRFEASALARAIEDGLTHTSLVATQLAQLLAEREGRAVPPTLRAILLGGGPVPLDLLHRARAAGYPVLTTYGLTETSSGVACGGAEQATLDDPAAARALPGVHLRVTPEDEILVRGEMVFGGYLDDPTATARALPGDGWLHTGDHGTLDQDGLLRVVVRRDDLIISGGENVTPGEVEAVLQSHPGVAEAAVVGVHDARWGAVPRAYLVLVPGADVSDEELARHCRERLAAYKVPVSFVRLETMPRNAMGKVTRSRLVQP